MRLTLTLRTSSLFAFGLVALLALSASPVAADDWLAIENTNAKVGPSEYWTPERMQSARPLPIPQVDPNAVAYADDEGILAAKSEPAGADGAPPQVHSAPELAEKLFEDDPEVAASVAELEEYDRMLAEGTEDSYAPKNVGSYDAHFSSSRVFPDAATTTFPYSTVGKLFFTQPGAGDFICSAAVIRARLLLTAGHCVHKGSGGSNGFFTNFNFVPALRGSTAPYGQWGWAYAIVTGTWANGNGDVPNAADYALIETVDRTISGVVRKVSFFTGSLGYQTLRLMPNHVHLLGYPGNHDKATRMHQVAAESFRMTTSNTVELGSDMRGGSSGGPWIQNFGVAAAGQSGGNNSGINRVVSVTSYGPVAVGPRYQGGSILDSRFTDSSTGILTIACAHKGGNC